MKKIEDSIRILKLLMQIDEGTPISEEDKKKLLDVKNLSLKGLNLTSLPESIGLLINLSILDVSKNQIILLPETIGNLTQLQELDVSDNQLNVFPESIAKLTNLDTLLVFNNNLTILPDFFMQLNKLRVFDFSNNEIESLPESFSVLHSLEMLSCSTNKISILPDSIGNLYNLSVLDLSNNPIYRLPYSIGKLKELRYMDLSRLHLHSIPEEILDCELDFKFDPDEYIENGGILLRDTVLDTQPIILFSEDRETIINYYKSEHMEINYANVFFLGDGGAGKTLIINRLWMNIMGNDTFQTKGINCIRHREVCNNKEVVLSIWDFGGQVIYHSLYSLFLKNNSCYVIVVNNRSDTNADNIDFWLNVITRYTTGARVLIVENLFEDQRRSFTDLNRLKRKYSAPIDYLAINAMQDNMSGLKDQILKTVVDLNYPVIPSKWNSIINNLFLSTNNINWIDIKQYEELCQNAGIHDNKARKELLNWVNDAGLCFYSCMNEKLSKIIVLSSSWLTGLYYALLEIGSYYSVNALINEKGIAKSLRSNLNETKYNEKEMEYILNVYEQFGLLKRISKDIIFFPVLLSAHDKWLNNAIDIKNKYQEHVKYELVYPYIPYNIMSQLMIKHYKLVCSDYSSRNRLVLQFFNNEILIIVTYNSESFIIEVYSSGEIPTGIVLQVILNDINEISSTWRLWPTEQYVYVEYDGNSEKISMDYLLHLKRRESYYVGKYANYPINKILYSVYGTEGAANIYRLNDLYSQKEEIENALQKISKESPKNSSNIDSNYIRPKNAMDGVKDSIADEIIGLAAAIIRTILR